MALVLALISSPGATQGEQFPSRSVRLIVPFAAGGPTDVAARIVADQLSKAWKQTVVVESRPGGGSTIGMTAVSQASPDGYTLLLGPSSAMVEGSLLRGDLSYDPMQSFSPVTEVYKLSAGLSVNTRKVPAKNVKELVALARSTPLTYSSFGIGTGPQILLETFKQAAGVDILHVPYKGNVPGMNAVVNGEVDMTGAGLGTIRPYLESGTLRLLAVVGETRSRHAPDVPTFEDIGYPSVSAGSQYIAMWAPPKTPATIVAKLNKDILAALALPEFAKFLDRFGYEKASATTPEQLAALTRTAMTRGKPVIELLRIAK